MSNHNNLEERHISYYIKDYVEYIRQQFYHYLETTPKHRIKSYDIEVLKEKYESTLKIDRTSSKKYTKIISLNIHFKFPIIHSYILNRDDNLHGKDFKKGDIFGKTDFFNQPNRKRTLGNVFLKNYHTTWYKPLDNPNNKS